MPRCPTATPDEYHNVEVQKLLGRVKEYLPSTMVLRTDVAQNHVKAKTGGQPLVQLRVHDKSTQQACMTLTFVRDTPFSKYTVFLDTLRLADDEEDCRLPGPDLVRFVTALYPKVVKRVELEDASERNINGVHVPLTIYRKFIHGVGWYEKFGLLPVNANENYQFQTSFERVRKAPFDSLRALAWHILRPHIPTNVLEMPKVPKLHRFDYSRKWHDQCFEPLVREYGLAPPTAPTDGVGFAMSLQTCLETRRHSMRRMCDFIRHHGLPPKLVPPPTAAEQQWLSVADVATDGPSVSRCNADVLINESMRVQGSMAEEYMQQVVLIMRLLKAVRLLYLPTHLEYPSKNRAAPRNLACTSPRRRCSK